jgi:hypothetical protein
MSVRTLPCMTLHLYTRADFGNHLRHWRCVATIDCHVLPWFEFNRFCVIRIFAVSCVAGHFSRLYRRFRPNQERFPGNLLGRIGYGFNRRRRGYFWNGRVKQPADSMQCNEFEDLQASIILDSTTLLRGYLLVFAPDFIWRPWLQHTITLILKRKNMNA